MAVLPDLAEGGSGVVVELGAAGKVDRDRVAARRDMDDRELAGEQPLVARELLQPARGQRGGGGGGGGGSSAFRDTR